MKVVINDCFGGFNVSHEAFLRLRELGCEHAIKEPDYGEYWDDGSGPRDNLFHRGGTFGHGWPRNDPLFVQVVEELGSAASSGMCAKLAVVEIPDDVEWQIEEYDGSEHIAEKHRTWYAGNEGVA